MLCGAPFISDNTFFPAFNSFLSRLTSVTTVAVSRCTAAFRMRRKKDKNTP